MIRLGIEIKKSVEDKPTILFIKLINEIIDIQLKRYKFILYDRSEIIDRCKEQIYKFDPEKGNAFSFYVTIIRSYLIRKMKKAYRLKTT